MPKVLIDTNLYIDFIRSGRFDDVISDLYSYRAKDIYFSSVVIHELLRGCKDEQGIHFVETLYKPFERAQRIAAPQENDWIKSGIIMSHILNKTGLTKSGLSQLQNDLLIAIGARRIGAVVYTSNKKDFELIAKYVFFNFQIV